MRRRLKDNLPKSQQDRIIHDHCLKAMKKADVAGETEKMIKLSQVAMTALDKPEVGRAGDWNPVLSDDVYLLYRCSACHIAPLKQNKWLRTVPEKKAHVQGGSSESGGKWRCAAKYKEGACLQEWGGSANARVLVIYDPEKLPLSSKGEQQCQIIFLGDLSSKDDQQDEHCITLLKTARLLKETKFRTDHKSMREAILALNQMCENRLISLAECRKVRSCTKKDFEDRIHGHIPYCEHPSLSIAQGGQLFNALYVPPETETITPENRARLLESLVLFYDLSPVERPKRNGPKRDAYAWMIDKQILNEQLQKEKNNRGTAKQAEESMPMRTPFTLS